MARLTVQERKKGPREAQKGKATNREVRTLSALETKSRPHSVRAEPLVVGLPGWVGRAGQGGAMGRVGATEGIWPRGDWRGRIPEDSDMVVLPQRRKGVREGFSEEVSLPSRWRVNETKGGPHRNHIG